MIRFKQALVRRTMLCQQSEAHELAVHQGDHVVFANMADGDKAARLHSHC